MLRFADLVAARREWEALGKAGKDLEAIVAGLASGAQHPEFKSRKHPPQLHDWLAKGTWVGWLVEAQPQLPLGGPAAPTEHPAWTQMLGELRMTTDAAQFGSYLAPARYVEAGDVGYVVALTDVGRRWIAANCWTRIAKGLADGPTAAAYLSLTCKSEFEALMRQGVK